MSHSECHHCTVYHLTNCFDLLASNIDWLALYPHILPRIMLRCDSTARSRVAQDFGVRSMGNFTVNATKLPNGGRVEKSHDDCRCGLDDTVDYSDIYWFFICCVAEVIWCRDRCIILTEHRERCSSCLQMIYYSVNLPNSALIQNEKWGIWFFATTAHYCRRYKAYSISEFNCCICWETTVFTEGRQTTASREVSTGANVQ